MTPRHRASVSEDITSPGTEEEKMAPLDGRLSRTT